MQENVSLYSIFQKDEIKNNRHGENTMSPEEKYMALYQALAWDQDVSAALVLISAGGIDLNMPDGVGLYFLDHAECCGSDKLIQALIDAGAVETENKVTEVWQSSFLKKLAKKNCRNLVYLFPEISSNKNISLDNQAELYRTRFMKMSNYFYTLLETDKWLNDFRLVVTPLACDQVSSHGYKTPKETNNYIVTPCNAEDCDLIEKIVIPSGKALGTSWLGSYVLPMYIAVELNDEAPGYNENISEGIDSEEHLNEMFRLAMQVGYNTSHVIQSPVKVFLEAPGNGFVEQIFDISIEDGEKTNGFPLQDGFVKSWFNDEEMQEYEDYKLSGHIFSSGYEFSKVMLSKEELAEASQEFKKNPWVDLDD